MPSFDPIAYALAKKALARAGIRKLSELEIDVDKDWATKNITNFGPTGIDLHGAVTSHASRHASGGADPLPAESIARSMLEYPTEGGSFAWLGLGLNLEQFQPGLIGTPGWEGLAVVTKEDFADKAVIGWGLPGSVGEIFGRFTPITTIPETRHQITDTYFMAFYLPTATEDSCRIWKIEAGTSTLLGYEGVDLKDRIGILFKFSVSGSTLSGYRNDMATAKVFVTDTAHATGRWGIEIWAPDTSAYGATHAYLPLLSNLEAPSSTPPKTLAYLEVPVVGEGTAEDPFRADMPAEIVEDLNLLSPDVVKAVKILKGKGFRDDEIEAIIPSYRARFRNLLSVTHSSLIKTVKGKPREYVALVRIFHQPDRDPKLRPIVDCISTLKAQRGVRELTREEAITLAKRLDDKLHIHDLVPCRKHPEDPNSKCCREYIEWRERTLGVRRELIDDSLMARYVKEEKGW